MGSDQALNSFLGRLLSWRTATIILGLLFAITLWGAIVRPALDGSAAAPEAPLQRVIVWEQPQLIAGLVPASQTVSATDPWLSDGGTTLYFVIRQKGRASDIYRSRQVGGIWTEAEPVEELNTDANELAVSLSPRGDQLYFCSDRVGGQGGLDIYVSVKQKLGWSPPVNLGTAVNSQADDADPAVSPDGDTLFFSTNRTEVTARQSLDWNLYRAQRGEDGWRQAETISDVNAPGSDERAPCVSPDGAFLLFGSNRQQPGSMRRDFNIYRSRIAEFGYLSPQDFGQRINTDFLESMPTLSPEGFTLVFSSNRDGIPGLYVSSATEVLKEVTPGLISGLDTRALWPVLVTVLACLGAVIGFAYFGRGALQAATPARFFTISCLLHMLLVVIMATWSLPTVVVTILSKIQDAASPFADQGGSGEARQDAWKQQADVRAVQPRIEFVRQQTADASVSSASSLDLATSPAEARQRKPTDLIYVAPPEVAEVADLTPTPSPALARSDLPAEIPEEESSIQPRAAPSPLTPQTSIEQLPRRALASDLADPVAAADTEITRPMIQQAMRFEPIALQDNPVPASAERLERSPRQIVELEDASNSQVIPRDNPLESSAQLKSVPRLARRRRPLAPSPRVHAPAELPRSLPAIEVKSAPPEQSIDAIPDDQVSLRRRFSERVDIADLPESAEQLPAAPGEGKLLQTGGDGVAIPKTANPSIAELSRRLDSAEPGLGRRPFILGNPLANDTADGLTVGSTDRDFARARASASKVALAGESVGLVEMFTLREEAIRKEHIELFGGTQESEKAVELGLRWLAEHQNDDGSWALHNFHARCKGKHNNCSGAGNVKSKTAATGLALLPFLAAGNTHQAGAHNDTVAKALSWLAGVQKENGDLFAKGDQQHLYSHSIAAIAVCEAYGMTADSQWQQLAERAVQFVVASQHKGSGGWRYNPNQAADTSVVGWAMMALKSGEMASILPPQQAINNVGKWLQSVEGNKPVGGYFGYQNRNPTPAMTAEGLLCLQFMGTDRNDLRMRAGADYLLKNLPEARQSRTSYYWYYATQVMYHMQGDYWKQWNETLLPLLVDSQIKKGPMTGTWTPRDNWEKRGGRIYTTALKLLMLEVYYRHLPLYEQLD